MTISRRPSARHGSAPTAQTSLSGEKTLDEAATTLADIEGSKALYDAQSAAQPNQPPPPYQSQRNHRRRRLPGTTPSPGIFWAVTDPHGWALLLAHPCALAGAEPYGDCLTCAAGHHETWAAWRHGQPKPPLALLAPAIAQDESEHWPRGRIVHEKPPDQFIIYADRQVLTLLWLAQIKAHFRLPPARTTGRSDLHYRSTRAIGPPRSSECARGRQDDQIAKPASEVTATH
jgi:hypothetical protein